MDNFWDRNREIGDVGFWPKSGAVLLLLAFSLQNLTNTIADPDLWGYLAFGRLYWETGRFPYQDVFSYLPTLSHWVYHEWLTGVIFYPWYQTLGAAGLQGLKYGLGLGTLGLIYLIARRRGADLWGAVLALILVQGFLRTAYSPVRAQVFTYGFFALTLYLLETSRLTGTWKRLWFLIPIQVIWCNLHGGFLAGLGLIGLYALGEALARRPSRPFGGILLLSLLATFINPYGLSYWQYLFRAISMPRPLIAEWASVYQAYQAGFPMGNFLYFFIVILFSLFFMIRFRWRELSPILVLALTLFLGLRHERHQNFFFLAVGAYLPLLLTAYLAMAKADPKIISRGRRLGWEIPTLLAAVFATFLIYDVLGQAPLRLELPSQPEPKALRQFFPWRRFMRWNGKSSAPRLSLWCGITLLLSCSWFCPYRYCLISSPSSGGWR